MSPADPTHPGTSPRTVFEARAAVLRDRVAAAARALSQQGIQPTVTRIRAALGGGSPNDLAPALKSWRESTRGQVAGVAERETAAARAGRIPPPIAELAHELWQRALAAASLELKHGPAARQAATQTAEVDLLRAQLRAMRERLERESLAYGELRAQAARHEAIALQTLKRSLDAETRAHDLLRDLGEAQQKIAQLTAQLKQRRQTASHKKYPQGRHSERRRKRVASTSKRVKRPAAPRTRSLSERRPTAAKKTAKRRAKSKSK